MTVLVISGTGTGVGKTVVTAAIAALAVERGERVAVLKPAQTGVAGGEPGDLAQVRRLAGAVTTRELRRYPDPLAPEAAARRAGQAPVTPAEAANAAGELHADHDLVLVEGAGGLLVRFDPSGGTLADVAWSLGAPLLIVAEAGLGTLNATALTAEVATRRGLDVVGVVIGSWPADPDLAARSNVRDLPVAAGAPLLGAVAEGAVAAMESAESAESMRSMRSMRSTGSLGSGPMGSAAMRHRFLEYARHGLSPWFGGEFDPESFTGSVASQA